MTTIFRVNVTDQSVKSEPFGERYSNLAGRGLTSQIICDEVPPTCHPLGGANKIVFAPGVVTGTSAPCSGRISVGGKSPLTGGIKEANAGTPVSQKLARLGVSAIVIEGEPKNEQEKWALHVTKEGVSFVPANHLSNKGTYEMVKELNKQYGDTPGFIGIGQAGEFKMSAAGIFFTDNDGRPSRYAARGGLGAVLGSKGILAIIVDDAGGPGVTIKDKDLFKQGQKKLSEALREHGLTKAGGVLNAFGTAAVINVMSEVGALPVRNFTDGRFVDADKISGEAIAQKVSERGGAGKMGHGCSPGCLIKCSNVYPKADGSEHVASMEYESVWSLGANLEINNLDHIAELIRMCNDYGLDTIETGVTIGVLMEAGYIPFGDGPSAIELLAEVKKGSAIGRIIGNGAAIAGQAFAVKRVPVVKKQALAAYDPRIIKGMGVTYSTSTMGADHTAGYAVASEVFGVGGKLDPMETAGKVELSRNLQLSTSFIDCTGYCLFIAFAVIDIASGFEGMLETVNAVLGTAWTGEDVGRIGQEITNKEREFNRNAGLNEAHDRLPEFFAKEALPPHNKVFDMSDEELDLVWGK